MNDTTEPILDIDIDNFPIDDIIDDNIIEEQNNPVDDNNNDFSSYMEEINEPKDDMNIDIMPDGELGSTPTNQAAKYTGQFCANMLDLGASQGLALIAHAPAKQFKADSEGKKELVRLFTEYSKQLGGEIPLWIQLTISITTIYGMQIPTALAMRKEYNEKQKQLNKPTPKPIFNYDTVDEEIIQEQPNRDDTTTPTDTNDSAEPEPNQIHPTEPIQPTNPQNQNS